MSMSSIALLAAFALTVIVALIRAVLSIVVCMHRDVTYSQLCDAALLAHIAGNFAYLLVALVVGIVAIKRRTPTVLLWPLVVAIAYEGWLTLRQHA
jgi:hypothetical protein